MTPRAKLLALGSLIALTAGGLVASVAVAWGPLAPANAASAAHTESEAPTFASGAVLVPNMSPGPPPEHPKTSAEDDSAEEAPPRGPELSLEQVERIALREAERAGDPGPTTMRAARGEAGYAEAALDAAIGEHGANPAKTVPKPRSPIFIVSMTGHFSLVDAPTKAHETPTGTVLVLVIDAYTGFREGRYLGGVGPDIEAVGSVVDLGETGK